MTKFGRLRKKLAGFAAVVGFGMGLMLVNAPSALAAPAGYGGPVPTCSGTEVYYNVLTRGAIWTTSWIEVWYSPSGSGTLCAKVYDNLVGSHHTEIVVRRSTWQTSWYDSGTYTTYAGGIQHFGSDGNCVIFFGRVTQDNGENYEDRIGLTGGPNPGQICWQP